MATDPSFAATVQVGAVSIALAETNLQVPVNSVTVVIAGANGTKIEEIVIHAAAAGLATVTSAGLVYLFLWDGTTHFLFDTIPVTAVTASATVAPFRASRTYANLWIKSGWQLRASESIANPLKIEAFGGEY